MSFKTDLKAIFDDLDSKRIAFEKTLFPKLNELFNNKLTKTGVATDVALKDDNAAEVYVGKFYDNTLTPYTSASQLIAGGYTAANGFLQGSEIIMANTSTYTRYEKSTDTDTDWRYYTNANGWQTLPV